MLASHDVRGSRSVALPRRLPRAGPSTRRAAADLPEQRLRDAAAAARHRRRSRATTSAFPTCGGGRAEGAHHLHSWFGEELRDEEERGARGGPGPARGGRRLRDRLDAQHDRGDQPRGARPARSSPATRCSAARASTTATSCRGSRCSAACATQAGDPDARRAPLLRSRARTAPSTWRARWPRSARARRCWRSATRAVSTAPQVADDDIRALATRSTRSAACSCSTPPRACPHRPRRRAGARRRLPRVLLPQAVRARGHGRALRTARPARRARAVHRRAATRWPTPGWTPSSTSAPPGRFEGGLQDYAGHARRAARRSTT